MYNHAPANYICPLCIPAQNQENEHSMMRLADVVYRDDLVVVAINSKFVGKNPGHVIVFPVQHFENIYELPDPVGARVAQVAKHMAIALKAVRQCDGVTTQQNNEPASGQHAFHYHFHLFPRWSEDQLYSSSQTVRVSTPEERLPYALALTNYLQAHPVQLKGLA